MAILVVFLVLFLINPGVSQTNNSQNDINTPIRSFCGRNPPIILSNFVNNRNSTLAEIRRKLSSNDVFYATAESLSEGDSVFGAAQCRNYLSAAQCVACFDAGVSQLISCLTGNGAYVFLDNCFVRYENYNNFYTNPDAVEDVDATPKTSNFYVASIRKITNGNGTVYAITQCVENTSQTICQNCINAAYNDLSNCLPNTEGRSIYMGCFSRYSENPFFNDNQTIDITNLLKGHSSNVPKIVGAIGGVGLLFILIVSWLLIRLWKKSKKTEEGEPDLDRGINYNFKQLQSATNNFSEDNILGRGGFGEVFKAVLDDNNIVAVKKIEVGHTNKAKEEFENEVKLISNVHHRNLLRLLGWSSEGSNLLLVLEYMPNGSLDRFLWGSKKGTLNWKQRYDIIFGFQPDDLTHISTKFAGTLGYTAPEYALRGILSNKVDTYSFGIVILEIISGRRCTDMNTENPSMDYLLKNAWKSYENKNHIKFIDETLDVNLNQEEHMMQIIEIALLCTQSPASKRPTMSEVVSMLTNRQSVGNRQLTRPAPINQDRRIQIGSSNKANNIGISGIPKELEAKESA
ncbi:unnamed protein product [Lactuca virosa]|uniref:Uncharacterized protein n=1 Tax=Lactuca virosa TaxID=75947 RepID=A0AAU9NH08_9ASTR|nr:unnamed protein product [Lactuca virosa]